MSQVIVVGGGLAGLSAVHTLLERGAKVLLLERNAFMGGNSTKATSGINAALTRTQIKEGVPDSEEKFLRDTALSASKGASDEPYPLARTLVSESAPAVHWLQDKFNLDLTILGRLGGHSEPRTHRGTQKFPGMTITMALMDKAEDIAAKSPERLRIICKAYVSELIKEGDAVVGVKYEKDGETLTEHGSVVLATGGYGYDNTGLLKKYRPELGPIPTTNGPHCDGSGIKMTEKVGGGLVDMEYVQVHPTGLVNPKKPDDRVKFLAAEALRGAGGVLIDADGKRFCNELGRRDYVSGEMAKGKGPFRLILNKKASSTIHWHVVHYEGRGLMKHYQTGAELAKDMGVSPSALEATFKAYNKAAETKKCPYGKKFFANVPLEMSEDYYVGIVTPVVHYTMGGVYTSPASEVLTPEGKPVPGLYATGEIMGGTHGKNRLGGSSLLDCVVFGRVAGASAAAYELTRASTAAASRRLGGLVQQLGGNGQGITMAINPSANTFSLQVNWGGAAGSAGASAAPAAAAQPAAAAAAAKPAAAAAKKEEAAPSSGSYTLDEVAKHNTEEDCWVVVGDQVLDVTKFMSDHPGGKTAILLFAGKDATEEFDMLHERSVIAKYAPYTVIGTLKK